MDVLLKIRPIRRKLERLVGAFALSLSALNVLALIGFVARDRSIPLAMLFYLPPLPLGLAAVLIDLARLGRSVKGPRFALLLLGFVSIACSGLTMIGRGPATPPLAGVSIDVVRILHWNVLWGGRPRTDASWAAIEDAILRRGPDVIVLSEAPPGPRLDSLEKRLGRGWSSARVEHAPGNPYWYKMVVLSRWPVRGGSMVPIRDGAAMDVRVERPGRPLRLLVVDGQSKVTQSRTPMLRDIAEACRRARDAGIPFDTIVGDFNAVGRSVGFDAVRSAAGGYALASWSSTGWRGTWPMPLPAYDIDHVWVHAGCRVLSCSLFASPASDHRGQFVRIAFPGPPADGARGPRARATQLGFPAEARSTKLAGPLNLEPRIPREGAPPMRILMATSFPIPGEYDGTAMLPIKIMRALKGRGVEVVLAHLRARNPFGPVRRGEFEGSPSWSLPPRAWVSGLRKIARETPFDLVHAQHYGGATRAYAACRMFGWPLVYEIHSLLGDEVERDRLGRGAKFRVTLALERRACKLAAEVIALGEPVKEVVVEEKGVPADRVSVIYPGIDLAEYEDPGGPAEIEGISPDHRVIMYVGSIVHPNQGVPILIDALPRVFAERPDARCVLVGGPAEAGEEYRARLGEHGDRLIVLTGRTPEEVVALTRRADVLVHPRLACRENYSVQSKIAVYLASGRPIVATDFGDYKRLLGETGAGRLTAVDSDSLADGLLDVLGDPALAARLMASAPAVAREHFGMDRNVDRYLAVYRRALAPRRSLTTTQTSL